jgi:hypothetical protein
LALLAASACSGSGTSTDQVDDANPASPEIKAIVDSDKSPKQKADLLKSQLFPRKNRPGGAKSQAR